MGAAQGTRGRCRQRAPWRSAVCVFAAVVTAIGGGRGHAADERSYANALSALGSEYSDLKEQAALTQQWGFWKQPRRQYLFLPPSRDPAAPKPGASERVQEWYKKFSEIRRERARDLFRDAKDSVGRDGAKPYQLLHEVLREDPEHAEARRILGYIKSGSEWKLPGAEKATPRQPPNEHPQFGWKARGWWSMETAHFRIVSNSQHELVEAGQQLEKLNSLWRQVFFHYWTVPGFLFNKFDGANGPLAEERPKMQVVVFKTRQEYANYMASRHPKAASTLGLYDDKQRIAYFFGGDKSVYPTWFHEGTHQLFQESVAGTRDEPGEERDFWALEAAALYMESLTEHAAFWTVGGWEADRLQFARYRVLSGDLNLPLARIGALSREQIQTSDDIGRIYTQAAGLSHFLIDGEGGVYRKAFLELVSALYRGEKTDGLLAAATKEPPENLDQQYRAFLNVTDDDLAGTPAPERMRNLSLCRTQVTDAGLARLASCKSLAWIDLSFTAASDEGVKPFAANSGLKQLFLEGTKATAASLPTIAGFKQLEQLDLSRSPIHDEDLSTLAPLKSLRKLYLTGCPITDAGLEHLRGLKQLEELDTSGTQVTPEGRKKLRVAIPKLKQ